MQHVQSDDPIFEDEDAAREAAEDLSLENPRAFIGLWDITATQGTRADLLAIFFDGDEFWK